MSYNSETDIHCPNCNDMLNRHENMSFKLRCPKCGRKYENWGNALYRSVLDKIIEG